MKKLIEKFKALGEETFQNLSASFGKTDMCEGLIKDIRISCISTFESA